METIQTILTNAGFLFMGMLVSGVCLGRVIQKNEEKTGNFTCDNCGRILGIGRIGEIYSNGGPIGIHEEDEHIPEPIPQNVIWCDCCIHYPV